MWPTDVQFTTPGARFSSFLSRRARRSQAPCDAGQALHPPQAGVERGLGWPVPKPRWPGEAFFRGKTASQNGTQQTFYLCCCTRDIDTEFISLSSSLPKMHRPSICRYHNRCGLPDQRSSVLSSRCRALRLSLGPPHRPLHP